jgi:hypothetical protein
MSNTNDLASNTDSDDNAFYINESLINSVIRLRTSLEYYSINETPLYNQINQINPIYNRHEFINSIQYITRFINSTDDYESLENLEDVKVTISQDDFNKLDHLIIQNDCSKVCNCKSDSDTLTHCLSSGECHVCLDGFTLGETKVILKCKHYFHKDCIYKWLCYEKTNCPICRYDVRESLN